MSAPLEIAIPEMAAWQAAFEKAPAEAEALLTQAMTVAVGVFEDAVVAKTPVGATGVLRGSITHEITGEGLDLRGRVFSQDEPIKVATLEHGRKAGRRVPPYKAGSALHLWVTRMIGAEDADKVARSIAWAIHRNGTTGKQMFGEAFSERRDEVLALFQRIPAQLAERIKP